MTKEEKAIREFCGQHADWWPSITQVQEMLALAHPQQEPVKDWIASHNEICALLRQAHDALASTSYPPQRTWVDLTRAQFAEILCDDRWQGRPELMLLQAQSKLKEKNTRGQE